ncbi:hypothetical protein ACLOJK_010398 [Asimina triloba]
MKADNAGRAGGQASWRAEEMLALQQQQQLPLLRSHFHSIPRRPLLSYPSFRPTIATVHHFPRAHFQTRSERLLAELPEPPTALEEQDGPVQLPPPSSSSSSLFSDSDEPSTLQVATSVLLTGAISVFLFRSLRRRARRAKEMRFRSSAAGKKTLKEDALDSLKAMQAVTMEPGKPPSPVQALLGAVSAGVIALLLYKFTTTIEASLNRQAISDNFSVSSISFPSTALPVWSFGTIVNGLCYLATFVFGVNSVGLMLYAGQLALNFPTEPSTSNPASSKENEPASEDPVNNVESEGKAGQQNSSDSQ